MQVDLFYEAGLAYMRDHVDAGGDPNVDEDFIYGKGFPLGQWVAEMRRRELTDDQRGADRGAGRQPRRRIATPVSASRTTRSATSAE